MNVIKCSLILILYIAIPVMAENIQNKPSIKILDAIKSKKIPYGMKSIRSPNIFRICIGGSEFVYIQNTDNADAEISAAQVINSSGTPKTCN